VKLSFLINKIHTKLADYNAEYSRLNSAKPTTALQKFKTAFFFYELAGRPENIASSFKLFYY